MLPCHSAVSSNSQSSKLDYGFAVILDFCSIFYMLLPLFLFFFFFFEGVDSLTL